MSGEDAHKKDTESGADATMKALPVRAYLDQTVVPLLLQGMS